MEVRTLIAKIAVLPAVYAMDKPFDYAIPPALSEAIRPGVRVEVPFGRSNRHVEGMVLVVEDAERPKLKAVIRPLDEAPVLSPELLKTAAFVRERCFCTFYDAVRACLPAGLWISARDTFRVREELPPHWEQTLARDPAAEALFTALRELGPATCQMLRRQFTEPEKTLRWLRDRRLVTVDTDLRRKAAGRREVQAELAVPEEQARAYAQKKKKSAALQASVLELLCTVHTAGSKEICYYTGATGAVLRRLEALGLVRLTVQQIYRRPHIMPAEARPMELTPEQESVYSGLVRQQAQEKPGTALLYGVTGSGKTAIYLKLIEHTLAQGRGAMLLVPEIALTPQLTSLFAAHFGSRIAVLHSSLRPGERYDEWRRIATGEAQVVIGTRSAVFAPLENPGLLILDEEQEHTYKSENTPRYHARDVAIFRGAQHRALVVLGSATPSVESMYRARSGQYTLYQLRGRYNGHALPQVEIVDLKRELAQGNDFTISSPLHSRIRTMLDRQEQGILFLNRRGSSRLVVCVDCGDVPQCPRCSVNLTYHGANGRLMCHYCGYSEPMPARCTVCGGHMKQVGAGTQKVAQELEVLFPETAVLRMDADTISAANPHERVLHTFQTQRVPLLVGTQMVAKGLDFENVTLVGVLDADQSLYVNNFRAAETTFSMITQVVGRAGRGEKTGCAVIQTMTPDSAVIQLAAAQDYDAFYAQEIQLRQLRHCPPFCDLLTITFQSEQEAQALQGAAQLRDRLTALLRTPDWAQEEAAVLGPAPCPVPKINNTFRYRLSVQMRASKRLRALIAALLREFAKDKNHRGVSAYADLNAYD